LNGLQNYNTAAGLNVVTDTISLQNAVTTTLGGVVTLNANNLGGAAAGTLTIGAAGDITSDGAVNFTGASGISTGGDVTTTGDVVNYNSATTLTGGVLVNSTSGSPTGGAITFSSSVTGNNNLTLSAGTANSVDLLNPLNDLATLSVLSAINLGVADQNSLNFGIVNISGSLTALSANNMSQATGTAISVGTNTSLTAGGGSNILLGQLNTFSGAISVAASSGILSNVTLADTTPIDLAGLSISQNLSLTAAGITQSGSWVVPGVLIVSSSLGNITLARNNLIGTLGSAQSVAGNFQLINQQSLNMSGPVTIDGNTVVTVAGQLVNQSGLSTPFAETTGSTTLRMLSPFVGGSLSPVAGFSGFTPGYNGVNPGARNSIIYSVSPLTMFAPSGTVIAGVDLSGTETGGGQVNTFLTGSDDLNWIISDFGKFNLPKVSSAGLEYTIYPKRVEPETRTLPDSTLSQLRQELGRPPTIDEINRREVSMRQSDQLRSGSILERSSLDSAEESNEPQENARTTAPLPTEGQVPQANQVPKKATSPDNRAPEVLPPVASSGRLPSGSIQENGKGSETARELLMKERASAEVGLAIPVANSQ
jgi:filamentous hemagglutinin